MPNQGNNGLDALIERILGDARKDAEATLSLRAERQRLSAGASLLTGRLRRRLRSCAP